MQFTETLEVVCHCIQTIVDSFLMRLKQKDLQKVAQKITAKQFSEVGEQFVKLISQNQMENVIIYEVQPKKIKKDGFAKYSVDVFQKTRANSLSQVNTISKVNKLRRSSIMKQSQVIMKERIQRNVVKLQQDSFTSQEPPNLTEDRLRKFYLLRLQNQRKDRQLKQKQQAERKLVKQKQGSFIKNQFYYTYDYNGKMLQGSGKAKSMSLATSMKTGLNKKFNIVKKMERKIIEQQTINITNHDDNLKKNRKLSWQTRENRSFEGSVLHQITPLFQKLDRLKSQNSNSLKFSEYKKICNQNSTKQYKFFMTQQKKYTELPTVHTFQSIPTYTTIQKHKTKTRMETQSEFPKRKYRKNKLQKINVHTQLYQSLILD